MCEAASAHQPRGHFMMAWNTPHMQRALEELQAATGQPEI
jgi:hypothetical protein